MTALGINVTSNEPETSANLPSGRLNLKGQQKPQYLIDAIEAEEKAYKIYCESSKKYDDDQSDENSKYQSACVTSWSHAYDNKTAAYARYNQECANG